jgi:uncharacterized protein YdaU (DUF1376 family)
MFYYQHHIGDFIKATSRLTDSQTVGYLRLLWMYYDAEKPLPNDIDVLAMQIGLSTENTHLLLRAFFKLENDVWTQTRCDKEIDEYHEHIIKKSNAGKASAERRKNNSSTNVQQVFNDCSTDEQLTVNRKPVTNNHKPKNTATKVATPEGVSESVWDEFIAHRKTKKAKVSQLVIDGIAKEAKKAGWSLEDAIKETIVRNWQSFKAEWVNQPVVGKFDVSRITTPARPDRDPALVKADQDLANARPIPLEVLAKMAALRKAVV